MPNTAHTPSLLGHLLSMLTKNDTAKEKREMSRYDELKFVDAGKEIKREAKKQKSTDDQ